MQALWNSPMCVLELPDQSQPAADALAFFGMIQSTALDYEMGVGGAPSLQAFWKHPISFSTAQAQLMAVVCQSG